MEARLIHRHLNALLFSFPEYMLHAYKINIHAKLMLILVPLRVFSFAIQVVIKRRKTKLGERREGGKKERRGKKKERKGERER